jgi:hypothetical protein
MDDDNQFYGEKQLLQVSIQTLYGDIMDIPENYVSDIFPQK